jgi:hypothetical protein
MIIRPRLNDFHGIPLAQAKVDFAIPFLNEDIPLYVDPFLLWKSPSQQDNALHTAITNSFNAIGRLFLREDETAIGILIQLSECEEVGLGTSGTKQGMRMGNALARRVLSTFKDIPQIRANGFQHMEALQLVIEGFSKDRVSDIACCLMKSFLADYTVQHCEKYEIPMQEAELIYLDPKRLVMIAEKVRLPVNPENGRPILFVPKRWLRAVPWLNLDDFVGQYLTTSNMLLAGKAIPRVEVLEYNRRNFDQVEEYIRAKTLSQQDCKNDPLFSQIPIASSKRRLAAVRKLPSGKGDGADKAYEEHLGTLLSSMLYPDLDFAQLQSRTMDGVLIRDLIFYNNQSHPLLSDVYDRYESRQLVIEMKNTKQITPAHISQLNRYLSDEFGRFGIIFTRSVASQRAFRQTIDLWSGQRKCILILCDDDLDLMCGVYESKQRKPIDVLNKKYVEFARACPS